MKKVAYLVFAFMLSIISVSGWGSPTNQDYGALPSTQMVAISPSGKLIAYRSVTAAQDVLVVSSIVEKKVLMSLKVDEFQAQDIYFLSEDLLFLRAYKNTRMEGFLGKFDLSIAWVLNLQDKKVRQLLVPGKAILAGQSGLGTVVGISPDKKYLYMPAWSDVDNIFPDSEYTLYKVNLQRQQVTGMEKGGQSVKDFFVDGQGNVLAKEEFDDRKNIHRIYSKVSGSWKEIYKEETKIRSKSFRGLTPDFKSLVFIETSKDSEYEMIYTMSLADGVVNKSELNRDDADIENVITNLQRVVYGVRYSGFTPTYKFFDAAVDKKISGILAKFPEHTVALADWSPDWKNVIVQVQGSQAVGDYFLADAEDKLTFITTAYPKIKAEDINPIGKFTATARDGLKIPTLLTIPKTKLSAMKNLPAIIYPHGGPASHDIIAFNYVAQAFASQGYLVVQPQFRGSTGFGFKHYDAGFGEWGKKMQDDITDTVKQLITKGIINPEKVCIVGASYGGYAALAGGAFTPDLYKCVIAENAVTDIPSFRSYAKNHYNRNNEVANYWDYQFGRGDIDKNELLAISPYKAADKFIAPTLILQSTNDQTVPPEQSNTMVDALQKAGKHVQLVTFEKENHYMEKSESRIKMLDASIGFVNKYIGQ